MIYCIEASWISNHLRCHWVLKTQDFKLVNCYDFCKYYLNDRWSCTSLHILQCKWWEGTDDSCINITSLLPCFNDLYENRRSWSHIFAILNILQHVHPRENQYDNWDDDFLSGMRSKVYKQLMNQVFMDTLYLPVVSWSTGVECRVVIICLAFNQPKYDNSNTNIKDGFKFKQKLKPYTHTHTCIYLLFIHISIYV